MRVGLAVPTSAWIVAYQYGSGNWEEVMNKYQPFFTSNENIKFLREMNQMLTDALLYDAGKVLCAAIAPPSARVDYETSYGFGSEWD